MAYHPFCQKETPMTSRALARLACAVLLLVLAGCSPSSKEDMLSRAREVKTRAELEKALGKPTDLSKLGPMETWTYKASNGTVVFLVVGDTVTMQATGPAPSKETK
jgi:Tfp pilus assembly protein PilP